MFALFFNNRTSWHEHPALCGPRPEMEQGKHARNVGEVKGTAAWFPQVMTSPTWGMMPWP